MSFDQPPGISSPIGILPTDLFITIITLVIDTKLLGYAHEDLKNLRLVSKRWHEVLDATPSFWSTFRCASSPTWITQCLERSKNSSLTIRWISDGSSHDHPDANVSALLGPHANRWKVLSLQVLPKAGYSGGTLNQFLPHPLPNLNELYISGPGFDSKPLDQFGGCRPHLHRLFLDNFIIPWNSAIFHSGTLEYLYLRNVSGFSPTADEISAIFLSNPKLIVAYVGSRGEPKNAKSPFSSTALPMPMLKKLSFDLDPESILPLLSRIPQQPHIRISLRIYLPTTTSPSRQLAFNSLAQHISTRLRALADQIHHVVVRLGQYGLDIVTDIGCMDIGIRISSNVDAAGALKTLLKAYPSTNTLALDWQSTRRASAQEGRHSLVDFFDDDGDERPSDRVTSISLAVSTEITRSVLQLLSGDTSSLGRWLCPNLKEVRIKYNSAAVGDVLAFARLRCSPSSDDLRVYIILEQGEVYEGLEELENTGIYVQWEGDYDEAVVRAKIFPFVRSSSYRNEQRRQDRSYFDWLSKETEFI